MIFGSRSFFGLLRLFRYLLFRSGLGGFGGSGGFQSLCLGLCLCFLRDSRLFGKTGLFFSCASSLSLLSLLRDAGFLSKPYGFFLCYAGLFRKAGGFFFCKSGCFFFNALTLFLGKSFFLGKPCGLSLFRFSCGLGGECLLAGLRLACGTLFLFAFLGLIHSPEFFADPADFLFRIGYGRCGRFLCRGSTFHRGIFQCLLRCLHTERLHMARKLCGGLQQFRIHLGHPGVSLGQARDALLILLKTVRKYLFPVALFVNNLALRHNRLHIVFFVSHIVPEYAEQSDTDGNQHDAADGIVLKRDNVGQKKHAADKHQETDDHPDYREHAHHVPVLELLVAVVDNLFLKRLLQARTAYRHRHNRLGINCLGSCLRLGLLHNLRLRIPVHRRLFLLIAGLGLLVVHLVVQLLHRLERVIGSSFRMPLRVGLRLVFLHIYLLRLRNKLTRRGEQRQQDCREKCDFMYQICDIPCRMLRAVCPLVNPAQISLKTRTDFLNGLHGIGNAENQRSRQRGDDNADSQMSGCICLPACRKPEGPAHEKCEYQKNPITSVRHGQEHKPQAVNPNRDKQECQ